MSVLSLRLLGVSDRLYLVHNGLQRLSGMTGGNSRYDEHDVPEQLDVHDVLPHRRYRTQNDDSQPLDDDEAQDLLIEAWGAGYFDEDEGHKCDCGDCISCLLDEVSVEYDRDPRPSSVRLVARSLCTA